MAVRCIRKSSCRGTLTGNGGGGWGVTACCAILLTIYTCVCDTNNLPRSVTHAPLRKKHGDLVVDGLLFVRKRTNSALLCVEHCFADTMAASCVQIPCSPGHLAMLGMQHHAVYISHKIPMYKKDTMNIITVIITTV